MLAWGREAPASIESPGLVAQTAAAPGGINLSDVVMLAAAPLALAVIAWRRWYRLADAPGPAPLRPGAGLILFFAMFLAGMSGAEIALSLLPGQSAADALGSAPISHQTIVLIGHAMAQAVVVALFFWMTRRPPARGTRPARAALLGAGGLVLVWPLVGGAGFLSGLVAEAVSGEPVEPIAHDTLQLFVESPVGASLVAMAVLVVLVVPVLEEVMYRGILQRTLVGLELGRWTSILVMSVIFAAMHIKVVAWHAVPALFVLSLGFGWIYERTGRLAAPIAMHVLFNAANLGLAWITKPPV